MIEKLRSEGRHVTAQLEVLASATPMPPCTTPPLMRGHGASIRAQTRSRRGRSSWWRRSGSAGRWRRWWPR